MIRRLIFVTQTQCQQLHYFLHIFEMDLKIIHMVSSLFCRDNLIK